MLCSTHIHSSGSFWHVTYSFLLFFCGIWLTQCWDVGKNVSSAAQASSVSPGGRGLVKAGSVCFGNLALVSDRPPTVCMPCLKEWRSSQRYSDFLLVWFIFVCLFGLGFF